MKVLKARTKSKELQTLESLSIRMPLSNNDSQYYYNLKKGYEGEVRFDSFTGKLTNDCIILNDLLLESNNTLFQIDSLIITAKQIYLNEIKNYDGDYYFDSDRFFKKPQTEITNPLHQLSRSKHLLQKLLLKYDYHLPILASVIFINPEYTLYQAPMNLPIIYPTQVKRYVDSINEIQLNLNQAHTSLAEKLVSWHIPESPFNHIPTFNFEQLQKGIYCNECFSFSVFRKRKYILRMECKNEEPFEKSVIRMVDDFVRIYPSNKIKTNMIRDWCNNIASKRTFSNILQNNLNKVGENRWTYYTKKESSNQL